MHLHLFFGQMNLFPATYDWMQPKYTVKGLAHGTNNGSLAALKFELAIFQPLAP